MWRRAWKADGNQWVQLSRNPVSGITITKGVWESNTSNPTAPKVTTTTVTASPSSLVRGGTTTLTVAVKEGANAMTSGTVTVEGVASQAVTTGTNTFGPLTLPDAGSRTYTATYVPAAGTHTGSSGTTTVTISKATPTVTLNTIPASVEMNTDVSLTWAVTNSNSGTISLDYSLDAGATWLTLTNLTGASGTYTWKANSPQHRWAWRVRHHGDLNHNGAVSSTRPITVTSLTVRTLTCSPAWTQSWTQSGTKRGATPIYRGYYSSTNGQNVAAVGFTIDTGALAGRTITKVTLTLTAEHWYGNGGGNLTLATHTLTAEPAAKPSSSSNTFEMAWDTKTGARTVTLPSSAYAGIASGSIRGVILTSASTAQSGYSYFTGGTGTGKPVLTITYQ